MEWISVNDRLPENSTNPILAYCADDKFKYRIVIRKNDSWMTYANGRIAAPARVITHWAYLDKPAK